MRAEDGMVGGNGKEEEGKKRSGVCTYCTHHGNGRAALDHRSTQSPDDRRGTGIFMHHSIVLLLC